MMQFGTQQHFTLSHPCGPAEALAWARAADTALSQVDFLQNVQRTGDTLSGELRVPVPLLGEVTLPFVSVLYTTPHGAGLTPQPLPERRGWLEITGTAEIAEQSSAGTTPVQLHFDFQAHLRLPESGNVGGAAFEKMVRATAQRTIERVLAELPQQLQASMQEAEGE